MAPTPALAAAVLLTLGTGCAGASHVREDCKPLAKLPPGATPPAEAKPGCFASYLRMQDSNTLMTGVLGKSVAQWAVCSDGSVGAFAVHARGDQMAREIVRDKAWRAVQACAWVPGRDAAGHPVDMWMFAPLNFGSYDDPR
jgi:hypothetical protein